MSVKVGFTGLGLMGNPMAKRIMNAGIPLHIWGRHKERLTTLINEGAIYEDSPQELAKKVDVILLCVTDADSVKAILFDTENMLAACQGKIIVDHSTLSPTDSIEIFHQLEKNGITYIDAPVTGGPPGAANGTLIIFAGGDSNATQKITPVLATYSKRINYMGEAGSGQATKICNQTLLINTMFATFETINLARQQNIDPKKLIHALDDSLIDSKAWRIYSEAITSDNPQKLAHIKDVLKDLRYVIETANRTNSKVFLTQTTHDLAHTLMSEDMKFKDLIEFMSLYD